MKKEILDDLNPDVVALWTVLSCTESSAELSRRLAATAYDQETFEAASGRGASI